ncbi:MAG: ATP-grasp domain-containing protein [Synoicihabitans sp.]
MSTVAEPTFANIPTVSNRKLNILVLGVGGNVSQGILKALAFSKLDYRVIGACTVPHAFGLFSTDAAYISPAANAPEFLDWLFKICRTEKVDVIASGVEPVLHVLASNRAKIESLTGAKCLTNTLAAMEIGADKTRTCEWLKAHGFTYPQFANAANESALQELERNCSFPLIAKPRIGKGSQDIFVLNSSAELDRIRGDDNFVVQEYLGDDQSEYTASCLTDRDDQVRGVIVFHRFLTGGTTSCAVAGEFPEMRDLARRIAEKLKPKGPCNVQMRMHKGHPVCFELNVRFSGTTPIRARLGFNDVEAAISHYALEQPAMDLPLITEGQAVRYWNEAYVSPKAAQTIIREGKLHDTKSHPFEIENYGFRT